MNIHVILFQNFETLDVFGPVEVFGKVDGFTLRYYSLLGGTIKNTDNLVIDTQSLDKIELSDKDVLFIPGGLGTRVEISNPLFIERLTQLSIKSKYVLTVCTGSALLAKTGQLDGVRATSNKRSFEWVESISEKVEWIPQARWVVDGKFYTSSGISAGIDMALSFVRDICSEDIARGIAYRIEYEWQEDSTKDNFYIQN